MKSPMKSYSVKDKKAVSGKKQPAAESRDVILKDVILKTEREEKPEKCPYSKLCGGCDLQGSRYKRQLSKKHKRLTELLGKFGEVQPVIGMEDPFHYRNKVHHAFKRDRSGNVLSGPYEKGSHWVIHVDDCMIEDEKCQQVIHTIRKLVKTYRIRIYNEDTGEGVLRHVLMRRAISNGQLMVVLVSGSHRVPDLKQFTSALVKKHPDIRTVLLNTNVGRTSMILGNEKEKLLYGPGFITDTLCGKTFRISAKSFYQVNPVQTEILYDTAIRFADLKGTETVIDAYCGIGTIGICASDHVERVIGVELNPDAVKDAGINAEENKISNISFFNDDAGRFMKQMAREGKTADVVFMDPPRAGSTEEFMSSAIRLSPKKIVYISCEPETLARDLDYFVSHSYKVKKIQPVDMFPYTNHIETVCQLIRDNK